MNHIGLAVLLAAAVTFVASDVTAADECGGTCDAACRTCCRSWVLRAACSNGKGVAMQGAYTSWREANDAAAEANRRAKSCTGPGPGPCRDYHQCGGQVAVWAAWCAPDNTIVRPSEAAQSVKELDALALVCDAQITSIDDVMPKLAGFVSANTLTAAAAKKAGSLQASLPAVKARLSTLRTTIGQMREAGKTTPADAKKFRKGHDALLEQAGSVVEQARRLIADAASVDRTAAERERKAEEARQAAEARKQAAERAAAEALARKEAAEQAAQARKEAAEQAAAEKRAAAAAAAAAAQQAAAEKRAAAAAAAAQSLDKDFEEAQSALEEADKSVKAHSDQLSTFLARRDIGESAAAKGTALARKLNELKEKVSSQRGALPSTRAKSPQAAAIAAVGKARQQARELLKEVNGSCAEARALVGSRDQAPSAPPPAAPPSDNSCEILFEPAGNVTGLSLSLEGAAPVPLPAKLRVTSGRHVMTVRKGKVSEQRSELILCARVSRVTVQEPR